jgi:hypothetical protein
MSSDFITAQANRETSFLSFLTLPFVYGLEITTCRYKGLLLEYVMLCYGMAFHKVCHKV